MAVIQVVAVTLKIKKIKMNLILVSHREIKKEVKNLRLRNRLLKE